MKILLFIAIVAAISAVPVSFADNGTYQIKSDDKTFDVSYGFDGELVAMDVDTESTSLLVGVLDVQDSTFEISFPSELLAAHDAQFVVLVDGMETDYTVSYDGDNPTISFPIPAESEEIEIIGTSVVPEFPFGVVLVMGLVTTIGVLFSKSRLAPFK